MKFSDFDSIHEKKIVEYFGKENVLVNNIDSRFDGIKFTFICFTNRCGSNYLCELLGKSNINVAGENLNYDAVIHNSELRGIKKFVDYLAWLVTSFKEEDNFSIKCSWEQLFFLKTYGYLDNVFLKSDFVFIKRENIIDQVASFIIADKTKQWTSYQTKSVEDITFDSQDYDKVGLMINSIFVAEGKFKLLFNLCGYRFTEVTYEDLTEDASNVISDVTNFLQLNNVVVDTSKTKTKKQKNNNNVNFINGFKIYCQS